jgi:hypothetical protein
MTRMLLASFWVGQVVAGVVGYRLARRREPSDRLLVLVAPWAAVTAISVVLIAALEAPYSPWDVVRLAPTVGLVRGLTLYSGRDAGPILSTMYTPVSALAYLPAALVSDPSTAAVIGRGIACLFFFTPLYLVCFHAGGPTQDQRWSRPAVFLLAVMASLTSPALRYSATQIHSDAPALGFAGLACWVALRAGPDARWRAIFAAATCAWLSVWSKQTMISVPAMLPVWAAVMAGRRAGFRFAIGVLAAGAVVSAGCLVMWGGDALLFNAFLWPGRLPWKGSTPANLAETFVELLPHAFPFLLIVAATQHRSESSRANLGRWLLPVLIGASLVPLAILGRVKKGGDVNSFSPALYPLLLACCERLLEVLLERQANAGFGQAWRRLLAVTLAGLTLLVMPGFVKDAKLYAKLRPSRAEYQFLRTHPGEAYFPWHPLAHLEAEGRLTHHAHSVWERGVAGFVVPRSHVISGIPAGCRYVCFPLKRFGPAVGFGWSFELLEAHAFLKKNATPIKVAGLPDYECYELRR